MYKGKLYIASDHGGYKLKKRLIRYVEKELKLKIEDMGPHEYNEEDDYQDYIIPLANEVVKNKGRGIAICRNGIGVSVASNKVKGIRAGVGYSIKVAESMMKDDNTNILALAGDTLSQDHAMAIVKRWLKTEFSKEKRHKRRINKVMAIEK